MAGLGVRALVRRTSLPLLLLLGACAFAADPPVAVLIGGDQEYRSEEALPLLAALLESQGFVCRVVLDSDQPIPSGLEAIDDADLVVLFTRFCAWPETDRLRLERALACDSGARRAGGIILHRAPSAFADSLCTRDPA